jgi:hypothetical protein
MICPSLLQSYRDTRYRVADVSFHIGERSPEMARLCGGVCGFLTAYNPGSVLAAAAVNEAAQRALRVDMGEVLDGEGTLGSWSEPMLLGIGLRRAETVALGRKYGQNAVVVIVDGIAELVIC